MDDPFGVTHPTRIGWKVERMGAYVIFKLDGAQTSAILPLTKGQARSVVREINRALAKIDGDRDAKVGRGHPRRAP